MKELGRAWMASLTAFGRSRGGNERANSSVGIAFVIGALVVAVLGLRWISATGPTEEASDSLDLGFESSGEGQTTGTTIPASVPAEVVVVRDPGDPPAGTTVVTLPEGQTGVFLPGFPPVEGGTTGTTGPGTTPGTNPGTTPGTTPGTRPTNPPGSTTPTTSDPTTTTADTTTTTADTTTTTESTTTTEPEIPPEDLGDELSAVLGALGSRLIS